MKKKLLVMIMVSSMALQVVGCGASDAANTETATATGVSVEPIESVAEADPVAETEAPEEHFTEALDDDGTYWVSGYLRASDKSKAGEPDEYGVLQAVIYEADIEDDVLTIKGVTNFRNDKDQDPVAMNDVEEAAFIVTDQTVFQMVGGEEGPEDVTKEVFAQYLKDLADTGLLLDIQVNGAQVVVAQICA